ncbi:MAG: AraC family transcriptional regulator [Prevotellaceae bacterium]|jgi:AraC-like DNA-binding protein/quercetin dioxygenase-like cupin family protein|nr:AraC family transcriptional regulator [Prevotellaceae bacterium]
MFKLKEGFSGQRAIILPQAVVKAMEQHELGRELHVTDIGYYPKAEHHYRERPQGAEEYIFIYCTDGQGWFEINGVRHKVLPNHFFIIPQGVPHSYGAAQSAPWTIYWMHFKGEKAPLLASSLGVGECNAIDIQENSRIEDRIKLFEEIYATLERGYTHENLFYSQLCLYHFLGTLLFITQFRQAINSKDRNNAIDLAIHYMRENMEKEICIAELAGFAGYSVSQFTSFFKQQVGVSPKHYYLQLKIRESCKYLDFTDMKINQLCYKVGIEDPFYFTRLFTKIMGCSPKEYRKMQKG